MTQPGTSLSRIVQVPFQGSQLHTVFVEGEPHVVLRPTVEGMGLDYSAQLKKLKGKSWATVAQTATVAEDGRVREMATVNLDTWAMLLANIDENRVASSIKPLVVEYQKNSARALREYWTQGAAINPSATPDQLEAVIRCAHMQMRVLQLGEGWIDAAWLEAKGRHVIARSLGEEPEIPPEQRPLSTGEYLDDKGLTDAEQRRFASNFGKKVKALYIARRGHEPAEVERFVGGALRKVKGYTEADRPLFDEVFAQMAALV